MSHQAPTSHCPLLFSPAATTVPSDFRPTVWEHPAHTATMSHQAPTSHCPSSFFPAATTVPSDFRPTVWEHPTHTATMSHQAPTSHCPSSFFPAAATVPSDFRPTVWDPAHTATMSRQAPTSRSSLVAATVPSVFRPTVRKFPAAINFDSFAARLRSSTSLVLFFSRRARSSVTAALRACCHASKVRASSPSANWKAFFTSESEKTES